MMKRNVFRSYCNKKISQILNELTSAKWWAEKTFYGSRIDVFGEDMKVLYLLEIELRREDPVNNAVKIYRAIDKGLWDHPPKKIVFIHVFSAFYKRRLAKRENATFAGKKMAEALENVEYKTIMWNLIPPVKGEEFPQDTEEQIQVLCNKIANIISLVVGEFHSGSLS